MSHGLGVCSVDMWVDFDERGGRRHLLADPMSAANQRLLEPGAILVVSDDEDMEFACRCGVARWWRFGKG